MSAERTRPPPFYCPACGKKHRADLSAIQGHPGAVAKVACARCKTVMALHIGDDGLPKCELPDHTVTKVGPAAASAPSPPGTGLPSGGVMSKPALLVPVLAAAVIAAVVSFVVAQAAGGGAAPPKAGAADAGALEKTIQELRAEVAGLKEALGRTDAAAAHAKSDNDARLLVLGERMAKLEGAVATRTGEHESMKASAAAAAEATKDFNGRIEANYTNLRVLTKRVEALEK